MITIAILILIVAKALPGLNTHIYSIHVTRITSIIFLFASALSFNCLNLENLGTGIGIFSGFFQVTNISQTIEIFLFIIGGGILIAFAPATQIRYNNLCVSASKNSALFTSWQSQLSKLVAQALSTEYSKESNKKGTDYSLIVLFSSLGSSLLMSSYDLISLYLSIELQSFGLYVLSTLYKDKESSTSAGLKYFLLGGLSSCILLLGTGIIYSYTGTTSFESLYIINSVAFGKGVALDINLQYIIQGISLGLSLIFIGFLFKIAAAPLHNWSPDVYDGTPTIVTTWLTIIPKIAILFILLELHVKLGYFSFIGSISLEQYLGFNIFNIATSPSLSIGGTIFLISSFLSLIVGSLLGLAQKKIKRLLAYSTISHLGFILLALSINTEQSIDSFIFYIMQYTITNLNIFLIILGCVGKANCVAAALPKASTYYINKADASASVAKPNLNLELTLKDISFISEFKGLFFKNPLLSISLVVSLFSMAGIPPLIGFFSKQLVLYSAIQNGYYFLSLIAIIVSVISCSYYLQIVKVLLTSLVPSASEPNLSNPWLAATAPTLKEGCSAIEINNLEKIDTNNTTWQSQLAKPAGTGELLRNRNKLTNTHSYLIATLTFTILFFFIKPSLILNSTQLLSLSLFYI